MLRNLTVALSLSTALAVSAEPEAPTPSAPDAAKYTLRYRFQPGEAMRWEVEHRATVRSTISGTTQTADTFSGSVKVWRVKQVSRGQATIEQSVERVRMKQNFSGRQEVTYDSTKDKQAPPEFEQVAKSVGVPLKRLTIDTRGTVLSRKDLQRGGAESEEVGQVTIPLPEEPIAVGHVWKQPHDLQVPHEGTIKTIRTTQRFELESVANGVATIRVETLILTPISDPALEAQVVQRQSAGAVRFDIDAGRVISQQMELDKRVVGFSGEASSMHYQTRFTEELQKPAASNARRPTKRR